MLNCKQVQKHSSNLRKFEAIQQVDGKDVVFVIQPNQKKGFDFKAIPVQIGQRTQDGQWVEITQGLSAGQSYVATGSFLLKSELEKGG